MVSALMLPFSLAFTALVLVPPAVWVLVGLANFAFSVWWCFREWRRSNKRIQLAVQRFQQAIRSDDVGRRD